MKVPTQDLQTIITNPEGAQTLVKWADQIGKGLKDRGLTTSQIRALFGEVRQIQAQWSIDAQKAHRRLVLLKPKMAYRARKERGRAVQDLVDVLDPALDLVISSGGDKEVQERFHHFVDFFEAILAYHKSYGGN